MAHSPKQNSVVRKPDSGRIEKFLDELSSQSWLRRSARRWWPKFVFHYSDVRNVVDILTFGKILCRNRLEKTDRIPVNCASPRVIAQTSPKEKNYVRLYFRPRTPTQYHMEGIRPRGQLQLGGAHCPVPVFLLLNSKDVLTRAECKFSNGNLGSSYHNKGDSAEYLENLPFKYIYHVGPFPRDMRDDIIFHRNAEVVIPEELDLSALRYIICRSPAERDTLIDLLPFESWEQWKSKILVEGKLDLFELRWTFVEKVDMSSEMISIHFSPDSLTPGPFEANLELLDEETKEEYSKTWQDFYAERLWQIKVPPNVSSYSIKLTLDGNLVYSSYCMGDETPF